MKPSDICSILLFSDHLSVCMSLDSYSHHCLTTDLCACKCDSVCKCVCAIICICVSMCVFVKFVYCTACLPDCFRVCTVAVVWVCAWVFSCTLMCYFTKPSSVYQVKCQCMYSGWSWIISTAGNRTHCIVFKNKQQHMLPCSNPILYDVIVFVSLGYKCRFPCSVHLGSILKPFMQHHCAQ